MPIRPLNIKTNARTPLELQSNINMPVNPDVEAEESIRSVLSTYELSGRRVERSVMPEIKFETLAFFFPNY